MINTSASNELEAEKRPQISASRTYEPEEFEADTEEERTVALLAERRRLFLMALNAKQPVTGSMPKI